ncbi:hypothetical protein M885DRAFT_159540 [Pelagophyceae sp. CCMP2097]|nr:hypothetical protein M885DRAFT_159540 [Pelagophyceae sp. CCMP2097]
MDGRGDMRIGDLRIEDYDENLTPQRNVARSPLADVTHSRGNKARAGARGGKASAPRHPQPVATPRRRPTPMRATPPRSSARRLAVQLWGRQAPTRECCCCYADIPPGAAVVDCAASDPHALCEECLTQLVASRMGEGDAQPLRCCSTDGCAAPLRQTQVLKVMPSPMIRQRDELVARAEIAKAGLINLVRCPFCPFAAVDEAARAETTSPRRAGAAKSVFRCAHPTCGKSSCISCREEVGRQPHRCNSQRPDAWAKGDSLTASLVRRCPNCDSHFIKDSGCNKMRCPFCAANVCYVCRGVIKGVHAYAHFCECDRAVDHRGVIVRLGRAERENCTTCGKCSLWHVDADDLPNGKGTKFCAVS